MGSDSIFHDTDENLTIPYPPYFKAFSVRKTFSQENQGEMLLVRPLCR